MSDLDKAEEEEEEEEDDDQRREEGERVAAEEHADFESRIQSLQSEVNTLTARLEEEQQRQQHNQSVPLTRSSLRRHDTTVQQPPSPEMRVLGQVASLMSSQLQRQQREEELAARQRRAELVRRLEEVERESGTVRDQVDQLHTSLKKLVHTFCMTVPCNLEGAHNAVCTCMCMVKKVLLIKHECYAYTNHLPTLCW